MREFSRTSFNGFVLENRVIGFFEEPVRLKSGRLSNWYANWRRVSDFVYSLDELSDFVISFTRKVCLDPDCFYGVPEGATKLAVITQFKWAREWKRTRYEALALPMGRGKPKKHGDPRDRFFIGVPVGKTVVLEDVTTTGGSLLNTIGRLKEIGVDVIAAIGLTNRMAKRDSGESVKTAVESLGIPYYAMSNAIELLPMAFRDLQPSEPVADAVAAEFELEFGFELR